MINYYKIIWIENDKEYRLKVFSLHDLLEHVNKMYFDRKVDKQSIEINTIIQ